MSTEPTTSPWSFAGDHCWRHVRAATATAEVADRLNAIDVETVLPIVSLINSTLIVSPRSLSDRKTISSVAKAIRGTLNEPSDWQTYPLGDRWGLRLKHGSVTIELQTHLPVAKPVDPELELS